MKTSRTLAATLFAVAALTISLHATADEAEPTLSRSDRLQAAVQAICPVSGNKLGENGQPTKVRVGKQNIFLCCPGCTESKIDRRYWATIHANMARAQGKCPVMKKPLPRNPKWTMVAGRIVYVCCPPCIRKIEAEPAGYLAQVDEYFTASLRARQEREAAARRSPRR